ncbi:Uncharacterized protein dnl_53240 [Desulfonema limicola]|uniref:Uncharacterized protein n=1 Tax=Desulfonema limicola TaxID=45656 RepID=A0A975BCP3_9BACT|nr:hypothetical protein [Desulfonema limicola]QTA82937.1 Uncharacterized protein dnl_53240 [Desulfonema limicola]
MEALRLYQKPEKGILNIKLPENMAESKELEIIIISLEREVYEKKEKFSPSDYFGIWKNKNIDVDKVCKEMRNEWERDF